MTVFEFHRTQGFKEVLTFTWSAGGEETEETIFGRMGYRSDSYVFCDKDLYWIKVYRNNSDNEHEFLVSLHNKYCTQYIACRSFADYLEFMKCHLPVIQRLNELGSVA